MVGLAPNAVFGGWRVERPLSPGVRWAILGSGTSDLFRVKEARYHCANRPLVKRGGDGIRTRVDGFAGRCLASR